MVDVDAIRAALPTMSQARAYPLLAELCDEVERLRAVDERLREGIDVVTAQRDAALRERDELVRSLDTSVASLEAAIAECERLRSERGGLRQELAQSLRREFNTALAEQTWRACADQLAALLGAHTDYGLTDDEREALAVYETLKGANS